MAQGGFAGFFLLTMVGCFLTLAVSIAESWPRIVSAMRGSADLEVTALTYKTIHRLPTDIPAVAQRLLLTNSDSEEPAAHPQTGWKMRRLPKGGKQLAFRFA